MAFMLHREWDKQHPAVGMELLRQCWSSGVTTAYSQAFEYNKSESLILFVGLFLEGIFLIQNICVFQQTAAHLWVQAGDEGARGISCAGSIKAQLECTAAAALCAASTARLICEKFSPHP